MQSFENQFPRNDQSLVEIASRLREKAHLKSVHVIPAQATGWRGWGIYDDGDVPFSVELGRLAGEVVASEFANALIQESSPSPRTGKIGRERKFRVGVAAGSTIHGLVESFTLPKGFPIHAINVDVEISPLVIGPVPETIYSAGFIAGALHRQLPDEVSSLAEISEISNHSTGFNISMADRWIKARKLDPSTVIKNDRNAVKNSLLCFDWVITGIGSPDASQLKRHLEIRYDDEKRREEIRNSIVGDICSRLFLENGTEMDPADGDKFVATSFRWLQFLSNLDISRLLGRRVIAVAGGAKKYEPLKTLLEIAIKHPQKKLFNVLITDELSARRLLRDLAKVTKQAR